MNPRRVEARWYGPYEHLVCDLPSGLTAILGRNGSGEGISSNGAGKTKLLELLPIALFGPRLPWSEYVTLGTVEETCTVELEFEHQERIYRVRRSFNPKGRGKSTLDFEGFLDSDPEDNWCTFNRESQAETQKALEQLLGLSEATFSQSVFAAQGAQHFADPALTPAQRKAVLSEALGLDLWDRLAALVRTDRQAEELALAAAEAQADSFPSSEDIAEAEQALALDKVAAAELAQQIAELERTLEQQRQALDAARDASAARREAEARRDTAKAEFARLHDLAEQAQQARAEADKILPQIEVETGLAATVPTLEEELSAVKTYSDSKRVKDEMLAKAQESHQRAREFGQAAESVAAKVAATETEALAACDRCGQTLTDAARETALNSMRQDQSTLETQAATHKAEADRLLASVDSYQLPVLVRPPAETELLLKTARESEAMLARLEARYEAFGAALARVQQDSFTEAYEAARDALVQAEQVVRDLPDTSVPSEREDFEGPLRLKRDQHTLLVSSRGAGEEKVRALKAREAEGSGHQERVDALQARLADLRFMERMYGRDGIPALLLESMAVPQIEAEAQRVLSALGTDLRVELRTQRALKTEDRQRETLDVVVVEPNGERSYASFSGGERTRINLALRIGLARLIAGRKGSDCPVLALDEPEFLDAEGLRRLPDVLRSLTEFEKVIVISHDEALLDGFDQSVLVVKDGDRSRIEP